MNPTLHVDAPAKINLGLEILGRRVDGFHEVRSILAMVDLHDTITLRLGSSTNNQVVFEPATDRIHSTENLITSTIRAFNDRTGLDASPNTHVTKRIPVAAGLGGASSNCAAMLLALNALTGFPLQQRELHDLAATLGSDAPFFLGSPTASASGRGTDLTPIRTPQGYVLIVTPAIAIPHKTATLYRSLRPRDFSNGSQVEHQEQRICATGKVDTAMLGNTFRRALVAIAPQLLDLEEIMLGRGCPFVAVSGAGPSIYSIFHDPDQVFDVRRRLLPVLPSDASIVTCAFSAQHVTVST